MALSFNEPCDRQQDKAVIQGPSLPNPVDPVLQDCSLLEALGPHAVVDDTDPASSNPALKQQACRVPAHCEHGRCAVHDFLIDEVPLRLCRHNSLEAMGCDDVGNALQSGYEPCSEGLRPPLDCPENALGPGRDGAKDL